MAVAWKLAVLLHRLLLTGEVYAPLRNSKTAESAAAEQVQPAAAQEGLPGDRDYQVRRAARISPAKKPAD